MLNKPDFNRFVCVKLTERHLLTRFMLRTKYFAYKRYPSALNLFAV